MKKHLLGGVTAAVLLGAVAPPSAHAFKKYARAEEKSCAYCHVDASGGGKRNYRGDFYAANKLSFAGFDDATEAKKRGVEIGPEPAPPPRSLASEAAVPPVSPSKSLLRPLTDASAWEIQVTKQSKAKATLAVEENALKVVISEAGAKENEVQVFQNLAGGNLANGQTYMLRFRAKADAAGRSLRVIGRTGGTVLQNIGLGKTFTLGTQYQDFEAAFVAAKLDSSGNRVPAFLVGASTGIVWIADVSLSPGGNAAATAAAKPGKNEGSAKTANPAAPPIRSDTDPATVADFGTAWFGGIEFVKIPAGTFRRGTTDAQRDALEKSDMWTEMDAVELPARSIRITKPFFLSKHEVTQGQWLRLMGPGTKQSPFPAAFKGEGNENRPIESVSWNDAQNFLKALGPRFRLPTEAEWEYACRAGSDDVFGMGADKTLITPQTLPEYATFTVNSGNKTGVVGARKPNAWGLFDLHGNVWEWCQDAYLPDAYVVLPDADPLCRAPHATERVMRGGSWFLDARALRAALRGGNLPDFKSAYVGFRIVREP